MERKNMMRCSKVSTRAAEPHEYLTVGRRSVGLDARELDHLGPFLGFVSDELCEISGRAWNPRRKSDAIDEFLRHKRPSDAIVVEANWRDNPWFPEVLEAERQRDLELYPDRYDHS
jgi:phage terminase large subunit